MLIRVMGANSWPGKILSVLRSGGHQKKGGEGDDDSYARTQWNLFLRIEGAVCCGGKCQSNRSLFTSSPVREKRALLCFGGDEDLIFDFPLSAIAGSKE